MDSVDSGGGVHVWSIPIPLGYCDDETELEGTIQDEEEVLEDTSGSALDHDSLDAGSEALDPGSDPLSLDTGDIDEVEDLPPPPEITPPQDEISPSPPAAAVSHAARVPDVSLWLGMPTPGPSSLASVWAQDNHGSRRALKLQSSSSLASVPDDSSAESADSGHGGGPELAMSFKAEPEDDDVLDQLDPRAESPPARYSVCWMSDHPPSVNPPKSNSLRRIGRDAGWSSDEDDEPLAVRMRARFRCKVCRGNFKRKSLLARHYRQLHPKYRPYVCSECGNRYRTELSLKHHLMLHSGERPFPCPSCDKRFVTKPRLGMHLQVSRVCPGSQGYNMGVAMRRQVNRLERSQRSKPKRSEVSQDDGRGVPRRYGRKPGVKKTAAERPPAPPRPPPEEIWLDSDEEEYDVKPVEDCDVRAVEECDVKNVECGLEEEDVVEHVEVVWRGGTRSVVALIGCGGGRVGGQALPDGTEASSVVW